MFWAINKLLCEFKPEYGNAALESDGQEEQPKEEDIAGYYENIWRKHAPRYQEWMSIPQEQLLTAIQKRYFPRALEHSGICRRLLEPTNSVETEILHRLQFFAQSGLPGNVTWYRSCSALLIALQTLVSKLSFTRRKKVLVIGLVEFTMTYEALIKLEGRLELDIDDGLKEEKETEKAEEEDCDLVHIGNRDPRALVPTFVMLSADDSEAAAPEPSSESACRQCCAAHCSRESCIQYFLAIAVEYFLFLGGSYFIDRQPFAMLGVEPPYQNRSVDKEVHDFDVNALERSVLDLVEARLTGLSPYDLSPEDEVLIQLNRHVVRFANLCTCGTW